MELSRYLKRRNRGRRRHFEVRNVEKEKEIVTQLREILEQTSRKNLWGSRQR